ncbi:class I SAM-dependent methyltransferase [Boudabousia marimammalium]|uniref:Methyltransferase type 11 domain-containing protein n=1 Tax=Boudabousia marimammalium TaxID=156892 RepID=A0A1Q5PRG9_9ACTO|nr:class I SAM-dependent methyltransferase [Boudabousia marimammalium]OKL50174.1 hypothetical protein BM477_01905 [Boudabousia marimammalium]
MANPYIFETGLYDQVRPEYPVAVVEQIKSVALRVADGEDTSRLVELGAGTGKMTRMLLRAGLSVDAVEPADSMLEKLRTLEGGLVTVRKGTAEETGLPQASRVGAVFAQSWHWCDPEATSLELKRILVPGSSVHIIYNQLDVRVPWVKRLTRIMRSGDVHRPDQIPTLTGGFATPVRTDHYWCAKLRIEDILRLGRTRSSYLTSPRAQQERMQANLSWYLREHLQISETSLVSLPYFTYHWQAQLDSE